MAVMNRPTSPRGDNSACAHEEALFCVRSTVCLSHRYGSTHPTCYK